MPFAIATPHVAATEAGAAAMRAGGTAVDGALAAAAVLCVAYPHMCALGGDAFALVAQPDGRVVAVDGSGAAPAAVPVRRLTRRGAGMPWTGPDTITVPGVVRAWEAIASLGARLPWRALLDPAAALARDGVAIAPGLARALTSQAAQLATDPGMREVFMGSGSAPAAAAGMPGRKAAGAAAAGPMLRQPALARTLEAIAQEGAGELYAGDLGARFVAGLRAAGSSLTLDDLAAHATTLGEPLRGAFRGAKVLTSPPPSQGFVLLEVLGALERLGAEPEAPLLARLFALASGDRERHLADPRHADVPLAELLSAQHRDSLLRRAQAALRTPPSAPPAGGDTVAIVAADGEGRAVSLIQSLFGSFGSGILEPSTGIVCHNRGASFSLEPESPNALAPGKRPAHTLMPVMTRRDGELEGVHGTMGGRAQPQIHVQLLLRLAAGASAAEAVAAPRFVTEAGVALAETGAAFAGAQDAGPRSDAAGHAMLVRRAPGGGFSAASDPRADGSAVVEE